MPGTSFLPVLAAAPADSLPFLREMVALFVASAVLTWLCRRFRLSPVVGFFLAGVLIGPDGLALVENEELIRGTAEVGVILLLFTVGVEMELEKLRRMKRFVAIGGGLQVGLTALAVLGLLALAGVPWRTGLYSGFLVALSSTAIVLKLLADRGQTRTPSGQITIGVLVFQDLAVVGMVLLIPTLASGAFSASGVLLTLAEALGIVALVLVAALRLVPPLLDRVAGTRSPELFLLTVVSICFGVAWIASLGGVSLALGAFLAGLAVGSSRFREHAVGEVLPLQTLFNAVFFVSIGMLLDLGFLASEPLLVLGVAGAVVLLKGGLTFASVLALRYPVGVAATASLSLAQIGEFSLVLAQAGREVGLSPAGLGERGEQVFLSCVVLLMAATPLLSGLGPRLTRWRGGDVGEPSEPPSPDGERPREDHVVVAGFGLAGRRLAHELATFDLPYVVVDLNPVTVTAARARDVPILHGDLARPAVLRRAGIGGARALVVAINDPAATIRIVQQAKLMRPRLHVVARCPYLVDRESLVEAGADVVVAEEMEAALRVVRAGLAAAGLHREEIDRRVRRLRAG